MQEVPLELLYPSLRGRKIDKGAVRELAASIDRNGLLNPITVRRWRTQRGVETVDAFQIIAGAHRWRAFRLLERETIPAFVVDLDELHAELAGIDENLCRNDLTPAERATATTRRKAIYLVLHPETKNGTNQHTRGLAESANPGERFTRATAKSIGKSETTVKLDARRGEALGADADLVARTSLDKGEELDALARMSPAKRAPLIARARAGEKVSARVESKKASREAREVALGQKQRALPDKRYGVILADPEWRFEPWSRASGMDRSADNHYPTSPTDVIASRPVASIAARDCVLFLWATVPMLPAALEVMTAWGFAYRSHVAWVKDRVGAGYWFRNAHELLLVGARGEPIAPAPGTQWKSALVAPVAGHSRKPEIFLELIEAYFPSLPRIELNRRGPPRPNWDSWGLEATQ